MATAADSTTIVVDGEVFVMRRRAGQPGLFDFAWLTGPADYGFTSAASDGSTISAHEAENAIRHFLAQVNIGVERDGRAVRITIPLTGATAPVPQWHSRPGPGSA